MMIRYTDHLNDDDRVRVLLTTAISNLKRLMRKRSDSLDLIILWLTNILRLLHTLKQYSGDVSFQGDNSPTQNEQALKNFDLSEYRQVLSDHAVWVYMMLLKRLEDGVQSLIVPAVLENVAIDVTGGITGGNAGLLSNAKPMENLTSQLDMDFNILVSYGLDMEVIQQVFRQIFYYICAAALNNLLLRRELCNWQKGIEIRYNVSTLEVRTLLF
jgi:myosin-5